jgi:hypothetical protein
MAHRDRVGWVDRAVKKDRKKSCAGVLTRGHEKDNTGDINCGTADFFYVLGLWVSVRRDGGVA